MYYNSRSHPVDIEGKPIESAKLIFSLTGINGSDPANNPQRSDKWEVGVCAWSSDGQYFAWSCGQRLVKIVPQKGDASSRKDADNYFDQSKIVTIDAGEKVWCLAFGSRNVTQTKPQSNNLNVFRYLVIDDIVLATGLRNGRIRTYDVKTGCLKLELVDHSGIISDLSFAPDGSLRLASTSHDSTLKIWDLDEDGNLMKTLKPRSKTVLGCKWSPDAKKLASVGDWKSVELWNMETYSLICRLEGHHHSVSKCDFSPDGAMLATASFDTRVIVYDVARGLPLVELCHIRPVPSLIYMGGENGSYVRCVTFASDGTHVGTICDDGYVRFWDIFDPEFPLRVAKVNGGSFCQFSPDGASLAIGTTNGDVSVWQTPRRVTSLQHFCRLSIRRQLGVNDPGSLQMIPTMLKKFLQYEKM